MGPVRQNPIQRTVRSIHLCALHCAILCATIVHSAMHTHMNRPNTSLDWVLSHWAHFTVLRFILIRSSPGDDLVHWKSGVSVRPYVRSYVRTSTKCFSDFILIWCVGRPRPHMRTSVTSTRSTVKVTELPKLRNVHFSRSISSAGFA